MDIVVDSSMSAIVDALQPKLNMLEEEYALPSANRLDLYILKQSLGSAIRVCKALHLHEPDAETRGGWVNRIRECVYDFDDWVDLLALRVHVSGGGSTAPCSRILRWARHKLSVPRVIASELRVLNKRVDELMSELRHCYNLELWDFSCVPQPDEPVEPDEPVDPCRRAYELVDDGRLVGLDGPMEELTKMVTGTAGGKVDLKIVSIVEMAGSGKTTLAAAVYRQLTEKKCFQLAAFISVGQRRDMVKQHLQDMLSELGDEHQQGSSEDIRQLILRLRGILKKKR